MAPSSVGSMSRAPGQEVMGQSLPEAETLLAFGRSMKGANLRTFVKLENTKIR